MTLVGRHAIGMECFCLSSKSKKMGILAIDFKYVFTHIIFFHVCQKPSI